LKFITSIRGALDLYLQLIVSIIVVVGLLLLFTGISSKVHAQTIIVVGLFFAGLLTNNVQARIIIIIGLLFAGVLLSTSASSALAQIAAFRLS
jgi:hypothetical protein